ncbi:hypothetical protein N7462_004613 [Penicillium macrosclerotiorum]|uniref:uncharacterized protein n=1 Tax=Penicillium macrosclerotiorum TaxID=303699 RepID=UPI00254919FA|nr:uncharacterized protein N7462_004613 [Penicillium macrosclerotiorum]KAJ5690221.1 hypothetical protein N7462_004613 [Penicillium macrosclerotiorum]
MYRHSGTTSKNVATVSYRYEIYKGSEADQVLQATYFAQGFSGVVQVQDFQLQAAAIRVSSLVRIRRLLQTAVYVGCFND